MVSLALLIVQWLEDVRDYLTNLFTNSETYDVVGSLAQVVSGTDILSVLGLDYSRSLNDFAPAPPTVGLNEGCCAPPSNTCVLPGSFPAGNPRRFSFAMNPIYGLESIELSTYLRGSEHHFCPIPLDADIFCDSCNCPIYNLGSGPVCQKCADCHITCHEWCTKSVRVPCNVSFSVDRPLSSDPATEVGSFTNGDVGFVSPSESFPASQAPLSIVNSHPMISDSPILACRCSHEQSTGCECPKTSIVLPASEPEACENGPVSIGRSQCETERSLSTLHPSTIGRSNTELGRLRRPCNTNLSVRRSFLAGHSSDATAYSRLSYDFSSLDRKTIDDCGIRVRELNLNSSDQLPPCHSQRNSNSNQSVSPQQLRVPSPNTYSDFGVASVMQTTVDFTNRKPRRGVNGASHPAPSPPLAIVAIGPRGKLPYTSEQLPERLKVFNSNEFGLQSRLVSHLPPNDCEGTVRIHINLLRPIHMLLTVRPVSIFDLVGKEDDTDGSCPEDAVEFSWDIHSSAADGKCLDHTHSSGLFVDGIHFYPPKSAVTANTPSFSADCCTPFSRVERRLSRRLFGANPQSATFWLPRGSTKLLYVRLSTTAQKVIVALLDRFQIEDTPQKFALYEHTIEGDQQVSVRKLYDDESPLGLFLRWTEEGETKFNQLLCVKRLVLQENETGDIEWNGFSLPELNTFLGILNQEEADYRRKIELKYDLRRKEVLRLIALHERQRGLQVSSAVVTGVESSDSGTLPTRCCRAEESSSKGSADDMRLSLHPSIDSSPNPISAAILPVLKNPSEESPVFPDHNVPNDHLDFAPDHNSVGSTCTSANTSPSHSPERIVNKTVNTLPRLLGADDFGKTLFRPSAYKQMKKADKAEQKRLERVEKERLKAEKKRLKAEAKLARQNPSDVAPTHSRRFFNLVILPRTSSPFSPTDSHPTLRRS